MISMNNLLPVIPQPPHDPMSWLLNALAGWRAGTLENVEQAATNGVLVLAPKPGRGRSLTEKSGSFGGLTLPANVALGPENNVYLLDNTAIELNLSSPCTNLFQPVPCLAAVSRETVQ